MSAAPQVTSAGKQRRRLTDIVNDLLQLIEEGEGEVTDMIDALDLELEDKVEAYAATIKQLTAEAKAFAELEKAYKGRKCTRERAADSLKQRLHEQLTKAGFDQIQTKTVTASFRLTQAVEITDEEAFLASAEDRFVKVTQSPNKAALHDALAKGEVVEHAQLVTNRSLQLR